MTTGQRIGYLRVSSVDQNEARQIEGIKSEGITLDKTFIDKSSGKTRHRPGLEQLLGYAREGDTVIVYSIDRLARNLEDLLALVRQFTDKGVTVRFLKGNLVFGGAEDSPISRVILSVLGTVAEFEHAMIKERQAEGIAAAKARGERTGRPNKLSPEQITEIQSLAAAGVPKAQLARQFFVHRNTILAILAPKTQTQGN